ncbi:hypothetical protein [Providencia manganoxydans]|uniref:hypothetical protein n=1 Tax=Providencia manganoxydans TaxID=2923283 RepID=UPI0034E5A67E
MASHAQNNSAQWDSIYDQQFVLYVHEKAPVRAEALLTNTSDVAIGQLSDNAHIRRDVPQAVSSQQ